MKSKNTNGFKLSHYFARQKGSIYGFAITLILASICEIFITLSLAKSIEFIMLSKFSSAIYALLFALGCYMGRRFLWIASDLCYFKASGEIISSLNLVLAKQAFKISSSAYGDKSTGAFVQRIVNDPHDYVDNLTSIFSMITDLVSKTIIICYIIYLNWIIGLVLIIVILICFLIEKIRIKNFTKLEEAEKKESDKITSLTTEIVNSEQDIKCIGLEEKLSEVSKKHYNSHKLASLKKNIYATKMYAIRNTLIDVTTISILIIGVVFMDMALLTMSAFMIVYSHSDSLYSVMYWIGEINTLLTKAKVSAKRMRELFDESKFKCEHFGNKKIKNPKGKITFNNVAFSYKDENKSVKVFEKLSFTIKPNTTVAFVGKSGSGKSTLLNLISKMYECEEGQVLIDNINIKDLSKEALRSTISQVNQFPYIFDMSIKDNLLLAKPNATDEEITEVLNNASLLDFVNSLPNGINTHIGEKGIKLSGGQRQRLAIARALLRKSSILILDESTSSLDNLAQENIKKSIDNLKGKSTIVIVAHRLSTIKNVDKIFFLEEGKIMDSGTFDELFDKNEKFKTMFLAENI